MNKDDSTHVIERLHERYGLSVTADEVRQIEQRLWWQEGRLQNVTKTGCEVWEVQVRHKVALFIYDRKRRQIVTCVRRCRYMEDWARARRNTAKSKRAHRFR